MKLATAAAHPNGAVLLLLLLLGLFIVATREADAEEVLPRLGAENGTNSSDHKRVRVFKVNGGANGADGNGQRQQPPSRSSRSLSRTPPNLGGVHQPNQLLVPVQQPIVPLNPQVAAQQQQLVHRQLAQDLPVGHGTAGGLTALGGDFAAMLQNQRPEAQAYAIGLLERHFTQPAANYLINRNTQNMQMSANRMEPTVRLCKENAQRTMIGALQNQQTSHNYEGTPLQVLLPVYRGTLQEVREHGMHGAFDRAMQRVAAHQQPPRPLPPGELGLQLPDSLAAPFRLPGDRHYAFNEGGLAMPANQLQMPGMQRQPIGAANLPQIPGPSHAAPPRNVPQIPGPSHAAPPRNLSPIPSTSSAAFLRDDDIRQLVQGLPEVPIAGRLAGSKRPNRPDRGPRKSYKYAETPHPDQQKELIGAYIENSPHLKNVLNRLAGPGNKGSKMGALSGAEKKTLYDAIGHLGRAEGGRLTSKAIMEKFGVSSETVTTAWKERGIQKKSGRMGAPLTADRMDDARRRMAAGAEEPEGRQRRLLGSRDPRRAENRLQTLNRIAARLPPGRLAQQEEVLRTRSQSPRRRQRAEERGREKPARSASPRRGKRETADDLLTEEENTTKFKMMSIIQESFSTVLEEK